MLGNLKSELLAKSVAAGRHAARWSRIAPIAVALLAAAFGWFCAYVPIMSTEWSIFGFFVAALSIGGLTYMQVTTPIVAESIGTLVQAQEEMTQAREAVEFGTTFTVLSGVLLKYVESRVIEPIGSDADLAECVLEVLNAVADSGASLFGFSRSEKWSLTVYRADIKNRLLVPVGRVASDTHPGRNRTPRSWRFGEGHVGAAFEKNLTIATPDAALPEVAPFINVDPGKAMPGDTSLYLSYISSPFGDVASGGTPSGVLVATSNVRGRFDEPSLKPVEFVAMILAVLLKLRYVKD
jgi:hypothetical protein